LEAIEVRDSVFPNVEPERWASNSTQQAALSDQLAPGAERR